MAARKRSVSALQKWDALVDSDMEQQSLSSNQPSMTLTAAQIMEQRQHWLPEDEWRACHNGLFFPVGPLKQGFDFVIMSLVVYACIVAPYRAAFEEADGNWFWFESVVQLIFLVDVMCSFNTAYLEKERWIINRPSIVARYLSGWFWIDFPSSIPLELMERYLEQANLKSEGISKMLPSLRALRLFRLVRLLRLLRIGDLMQRIEDHFGVDLSALRMVNTIILLLAFCHVLACIFYASAMMTEGVEKTWVTFFDNGYMLAESTPVFDAYIISYLWAIGLVCGQNTNITPESMTDRALSIAVYLLATLFFAYIIAVVTNQLNSVVNDPRALALDNLSVFVRFHGIPHTGPSSLGERLKSYYDKFYASRSMVEEEEIIGNLTPSLRDEVMDHLLEGTIRLCPLLHPPTVAEERLQKFQEFVYKQVKPVGYAPKDEVLQKGRHSDDLFFLIKGQVNAVTSWSERFGGTRMLFPIFEMGAFFGEQCLLSEPSEVSYVAFVRTEVLCVPKEAFFEAVTLLDEDVRSGLVEHVWDDIVHKASLRKWGIRVVLADVIADNNQLGIPLLGDKFVAALLIQVWYLSIALKRLRAKQAAEMLPLLSTPSAGLGKPLAVTARPAASTVVVDEAGTSVYSKEIAQMSGKVDLLASKLEGLDDLSKGLAAVSNVCERMMDQIQAIDVKMGSLSADIDALGKGLSEVRTKVSSPSKMSLGLGTVSEHSPSASSSAGKMASHRLSRSQDRAPEAKLSGAGAGGKTYPSI